MFAVLGFFIFAFAAGLIAATAVKYRDESADLVMSD